MLKYPDIAGGDFPPTTTLISLRCPLFKSRLVFTSSAFLFPPDTVRLNYINKYKQGVVQSKVHFLEDTVKDI